MSDDAEISANTKARSKFKVGDTVKFVTSRSTSRGGFKFQTREGKIEDMDDRRAIIQYGRTKCARLFVEMSHAGEPSPLTNLVEVLANGGFTGE